MLFHTAYVFGAYEIFHQQNHSFLFGNCHNFRFKTAPRTVRPFAKANRSMKFRFPIVIIDEDFRSENRSGTGIRELAKAIEGEGMEVVGYTHYRERQHLSYRLTTKSSHPGQSSIL
jgi:hypothetical protein